MGAFMRKAKAKRPLSETQRAALERARAARSAKAAAAKSEAPHAEEAPTLASLGLSDAEPEDDRLDDILTNDEIEAIKARAIEQVMRERKAARTKKMLDAATVEARREMGLVPADEERKRELEEMTTIRINLPRLRLANGREATPDPIILDQHVFVHGRTYAVTRAQHEYILDLMNKAWMHVAQVDGRSRTYYNEQLGTMVYQGGVAHGSVSHG